MCPGSSVSPRTTSEDVTSTDHGCKKLGLPKPMEDIPLPPRAYTHDRGNTFNFLIIQMNQLLFAMPNHDWVTSAINQKTGIMNVWNNGNIWNRVAESNPKDGIFVDVGGWVVRNFFRVGFICCSYPYFVLITHFISSSIIRGIHQFPRLQWELIPMSLNQFGTILT